MCNRQALPLISILVFNLILAVAWLAPGPTAHAATPGPALSPAALTPYLFDAARSGDGELVSELLARGVEIEASNERGFTALILAAYNGQPQLVEQLLAQGASPNTADRLGNTALMGALFRGDTAAARALLAAPQIEINQRNRAGQTAAMFAALFGRTELLLVLAERGADLAAIDAAGASVKSLAEQQGHTELLEALAQRAR